MNGDRNVLGGSEMYPPYIPVGTELGVYRIESYVNRGDLSSVYEATDLKLNRRVALKVFSEELTEESEFWERFVRASRFAASLAHPNIVPIYDAGVANDHLYIAAQYIRGSDLATALRERGPLDAADALAILGPVADALDTAHAAGLVHGDVKSANILLSAIIGREGHEDVYLTDFGLTKLSSALTEPTSAGHFLGTLDYLSPEQIRGEPPNSLTDVYALGCVAYECFTGVPPFARGDQVTLLQAHLNDQPRPLSHYRSDVLAADRVLARALAKIPRDRYQTCGHFTQTLSYVLLSGRHRKSRMLTVESAGQAPVSETDPGTSIRDSRSDVFPADNGHAREREAQQPGGRGSHAEPPRMNRLTTGDGSDDGPAETPRPVEPPSVAPRSPRPRRRAIIFVVAAAAVVVGILTVVLVVEPVAKFLSDRGALGGTSLASTAPVSAPQADTEEATIPNSPASLAQQVPPEIPSAQPVSAMAIPAVEGKPIDVGATPGFVAVTPDGRHAYIANRAAGFVTVVDTTIDKVIAKIPMPAGPPQYIAFTPDGNHAYVSIFDAEKTINLVAVLDTQTTRVQQTIVVDQRPVALAVSPDQHFVYVPSHDAGAIDIIDIEANKLVRKVAVPANPHWIRFATDGKVAYIANHESNVLSVLDTASNTIIQTIAVGTSPHSVAVSPDGRQVAVVCFDSNDISLIDTTTNQVSGTVMVGTNPQDVAYSPDGRYLYTANVESNTVSVVDTVTRTVTASVPTNSPTSIAALPNGLKAYVTNLDAGTLTVLNTGR